MEDITKKCGRCQVHKYLSEFNKCKHGTLGVHGHCRECQKQVRKAFYETKQKPTKYWLSDDHRDYNRRSSKIRYHSDSTWREKRLQQNKERRRLEPAKVKARQQRQRWYAIPENKIACALRVRLRRAIRFNEKIDHTEKLLGCSFEFVKKHLELQFQQGMSWDNYGEWQIDHIIPCNFFDLSNPDHQTMCFNFRNLQPLWKDHNRSKGSKITIDNYEEFLNELRKVVVGRLGFEPRTQT